MHSGVFTVKGVKMSKSLKNFITIREALKAHSAESIRLLFCSTHYRKDVDYSEEAIAEAEKRLGYLYAALSLFYNMKESPSAEPDSEIAEAIKEMRDGFTKAMDDDFNTPLALSNITIALNALRAFSERNGAAGKAAKEGAIIEILGLAKVLGILEDEAYKEPVPKEAISLIKKREELRKKRSFKESDEIREVLKKDYRIIVEDSSDGMKWYREMGKGKL